MSIPSLGLAVGLVLIACSTSNAESSFRGITVLDTPETIQGKVGGDYHLEWGEPIFETSEIEKTVRVMMGDEQCASINFDAESKVSSMLFFPCYFNAQDLSLSEVTHEFTAKFGGTAELEFLPEPICNTGSNLKVAGRTDEGELFEIFEGIVSWSSCGVVVKIVPGSGKIPTF